MVFPASDLSRNGSWAVVGLPALAEPATAELPGAALAAALLLTAALLLVLPAELAGAEGEELVATALVLVEAEAVPLELLLQAAVTSIAVHPAAMAAFDFQRMW